MSPSEIRFAADGMLQSLATWLRVLGCDCLAGCGLFGRELLERAVADGRVFLTRNTHLSNDWPRALAERAEVFFYVPVFSKGPPPATAEERWGRLRGVTQGLFRLRDLLARTIPDTTARQVEVLLLDQSPEARNPFLSIPVANRVRSYIRGGYRLVDAESHELDRHGRLRIFLNDVTGIVEDGRLLRTWAIQRDITRQRQIEDEKAQMERRLVEFQKLESLGFLAGGIAHDFNNLLTSVFGNASRFPAVFSG